MQLHEINVWSQALNKIKLKLNKILLFEQINAFTLQV